MSSTGSVACLLRMNIQGVGDTTEAVGRILWRNSTREAVRWLMNGATITTPGKPGTPALPGEIAP